MKLKFLKSTLYSLICCLSLTTFSGCTAKIDDSYTEIKSIKGLTFNIPKELDDNKKSYEEFNNSLQNIDTNTEDMEKIINDSVIYEESESNYSLVKPGMFDLLAFSIADFPNIIDFKTVRDFTDKCYIGDISLTQEGEPIIEETDEYCKQIFTVDIGVIENIPQYTEAMFTTDDNGGYVLNQEAVDEAVANNTLAYKQQYTKTNNGYLILISNNKTEESYGVLTGYSVSDDNYADECLYISKTVSISDSKSE